MPNRRLVTTIALVFAVGLLAAADRAPKPQPHDRWSQNDEMERPSETAAAWGDQVAEGAQGAAPVFAGCYMWRGRADRDYKPFHQWEIKLQGGTQDVTGLALRMIVLGPDMKPLLGERGEGHWVELGRLAAGETVDLSYKLNCSAPTAVRAETRWEGGAASYLAPDPKTVPTLEGDPATQAKLLVLQPDFEYSPRKRAAKIGFFLRNDGGKPATGVVHVVKLVDHEGKVVHEVEHVPTEDGSVPAGFAEHITFVLQKVPKFDNIQVSTRSAESTAGGLSLDGGAFTEAEDIEVAQVSIEGGELTASVRNGLKEPVTGLSVELQLLDGDGKTLKRVTLPAGDLASGERKELSAEVGELPPVLAWGVGFSFGAAPAAPEDGGTAAAPGAIPPMDVDGVQLRIKDVEAVGTAVKLELAITNTKDSDLAGLRCELQVQNAAGTSITIPLEVGDLAAGASFEGAVIGEGVADVAGIQMGWSTGG